MSEPQQPLSLTDKLNIVVTATNTASINKDQASLTVIGLYHETLIREVHILQSIAQQKSTTP
jgi:nicotinic acid phosphoribosyltransferase